MAEIRTHLKHLSFPITANSQPFKRGAGGGKKRFIRTNPRGHGARLKAAYDKAVTQIEEEYKARLAEIRPVRSGFYLEFEGASEIELKLESLDVAPLELMSVRHVGDKYIATVFVPKDSIEKFREKIDQYLREPTEVLQDDGTLKEGNRKNYGLIDPIEDIRPAELLSLWMDPEDQFPTAGQKIWWEVWIPSQYDRYFLAAAKDRLQLGRQPSIFPERKVFAAFGDFKAMDQVRLACGAVAELRGIKNSAEFFMDLSPKDQQEWLEDLSERVKEADGNAPSVCLLDTGVNNGHPLLAASLASDDMHAYHPDWPKTDSGAIKHGTRMAGAALYGNLSSALESASEIPLSHRLESVRILPPFGYNPEDLYGSITLDAMTQVQVQAPARARSICLAITADNYYGGLPSEWSATIDEIIFEGQGSQLFNIASGNVWSNMIDGNYLEACDLTSIQDPAQSWNSLTIGAYTDYHAVTETTLAGWHALASAGELSPYSRTSTVWERQWPIKPEVLFEGGNMAANPAGKEISEGVESLSLLTTGPEHLTCPFDILFATSAATAQASSLEAQLLAQYPEFRAETIRGLIVHGAEWTAPITERFDEANKTERGLLLRRYGYGIASSDRSISSTSNRCVIVTEQSLKPFKKEKGSQPKLNEIHLIPIPLPKDVMEAIGNKDIRMKVTLSYFVQPNPSQRGYGGRYSYASHGLRFIMQRSGESPEQLISRAGRLGNQDGEEDRIQEPDQWYLGVNQRDRGCVISDTWEAPATDLAQHTHIAVYPIQGWWKTRTSHKRFNADAPYSLIISFEGDDLDVDLYAEIEAVVANLVRAEIATSVYIPT